MTTSSKPETLAIIPARGGSKGIPGKNLIPIRGKPLLAWTVEHALATPGVTRIVVSTDDAAIAAVARSAGAEVVDRPAALSGDEASSESALLHTLDHLRDSEGYVPERVVFLQATSPLRKQGALSEALAQFEQEGADSLFSGCLVQGFVWRQHPDGPRSFTYDHKARPRRQDAPVDVVENGSLYICTHAVLREHGNRLGGKVAVYMQDPLESIQIDDPGDPEVIAALATLPRFQASARPELASVRLLALDFDGVLTDNRASVDQDGRESVVVHRGDGWGLSHLPADVEALVISTEKNPVVTARCKKLGLACFQAIDDKLSLLKRLLAERRLDPDQVAFVGNDVNDLACLRHVGVAVVPADAHPAVVSSADWVTSARGGHGAVREICDAICAAQAG